MSDSKSTRAERAKAETASDESTQAPAEQIEDFSSLDVTPTAVNTYLVGNRASGTYNRVDLNEGTCTCEDMEYNQDGRGACKHLQYVLYMAPTTRDLSDEFLRDAQHFFGQARDALQTAAVPQSDPVDGVGAPDKSSATDADSEASDESEKPPANPDTQAQEQAEAKAAELQEAFDAHLSDMQVRAHEGIVWFQTGRETEDEWPYPGTEDTFEAITSAECVMYVHDGSADWADGPHEHYDEKPGEWWKNALYPSDVETYISEVLE
jgi:hypothetical protein